MKQFLFAVAIASLAIIVVFAALPHSTQFMNVLHKTGHPLAFAAIALLVLLILRERRTFAAAPPWRIYLTALGITVLTGAATEIAQQFTHRDSSVIDVLRDTVGAIACLALTAAWSDARAISAPLWLSRGLIALGLIATVIAFAPLAWCITAYVQRERVFPVIAQLDSPLDMYFISENAGNVRRTDLPDRWARTIGEQALHVDIGAGQYPGMRVTEPHPHWRGFKTLAVDIANPGMAELAIVIRVHDRKHNNQFSDRFNRTFRISAGTRTTVLVPLQELEHGAKNRLLDLDAIAGLGIFSPRPVRDGDFFVSRIWLQ